MKLMMPCTFEEIVDRDVAAAHEKLRTDPEAARFPTLEEILSFAREASPS